MKQILVVAPPGRLQEGLQVLLATLSDSSVVVVADARAAEAQIAAQIARQRPQLVIVAKDDADQIISSLGEWPAARTLALVKQEQQRPAVEAAGADAVVVEGIPASRLLALVRDLLAGSSPDSLEVTDDCATTT